MILWFDKAVLLQVSPEVPQAGWLGLSPLWFLITHLSYVTFLYSNWVPKGSISRGQALVCKCLSTLRLLTFHWPKQAIWPSPEWGWAGVEGGQAKNVDHIPVIWLTSVVLC